MAEEEIDLNPKSTTTSVVRKRPRAVLTVPDDGPLHITVHSIVLKAGTVFFTKSRFSREISIHDAMSSITDPTSSTPTILSGELHGLVVKFFSELAAETVAKFYRGDGEVTEHSLIGDGHADCKVNK